MSHLLALLGFASVHLIAAISPGPAFVMLTRISVAQSRRTAVAAAFGLATGALLWAALASLGMQVVLAKAAWLYDVLKLAGGLYLAWLGIEAWRHAGAPVTTDCPSSGGMGMGRAWRLGLATNLANPKVIVFFGSIFLLFFAPGTPGWVRVAALAIVAVDEAAWFTLVALVFSTRPVQAFFRRMKGWIERAAGTAMLAFGFRLIAELRL
ncbi:MAG TPA: LysE family transporter [Stellaceae bacterium]|nr:LysE family transporter [Stellaceae bacterium]